MPAAALLAALAFVAYSVQQFRSRFDFAVAMAPFTLWRITIFVALVAAEYGAYMPEIGRQGQYANATAAFLIFMILMYTAAEFSFTHSARAFQLIGRRPPLTLAHPDLRLIFSTALIVVTAGVGYLLLKGMAEGFPLFTQTDRFAFRLQTSDYFLGLVIGNALVLAALLGVCLAYGRHPLIRLCAATAMAVFLGTMFLFGEKFFSILAMACVFVAPTLLARGGRKVGAGAWMIAALIFSGAVAVTWYIYSDYGRNLPGYTLERIMSRVAGQGQLWFAAWIDARPLQGDQAQWNQMTQTLYPMDGHDLAFQSGTNIFYLMRRYAPDELWATIQEFRGTVTYTAGTEAYLILTLGIVGGALATGLLGAYYGAVAAYVVFAMRTPAFVRLFLAGKLLAYTLDGSHQAAFWNIAGTRVLVTLAAILAWEAVAALLRQHGSAAFSPASFTRTTRRPTGIANPQMKKSSAPKPAS